jgi:methyl-accepting chemotaxis protein
MFNLRTVPLKYRLPALMVGYALLVACVLQTYAFLEQRSFALNAAHKAFQSEALQRQDNLQGWLAEMEKGLTLLAISPTTRRGILDLGAAYRSIPADPRAVLQDAYITANPNPPEKRALLVDVAGPLAYFQRHSSIHPTFAQRAELFGFYDIFLFDLNGNLVYTVAKEADFAQNFVSGPYAETGLGRTFRAARDGTAGTIHMSDLEEYAPSKNIPAGFMAIQVLGEDGKSVGVVAVQLPLTELTRLAVGADTLGQTGDAYLIGSDQKTRSESRFEGRFGILYKVPMSPQVEDILAGREDFQIDAMLMSGQIGLARTLLIEGPGITWGLIVEEDLAEIMLPVNKAIVRMLAITAVAALIVLILGIVIARSVTGPIERVGAAIKAVAEGDLHSAVAGADSRDEIGRIAWALDGLRQKLVGAEIAEAERERLQIEQSKVVDALSLGLRNLATGDLSQPIVQPFTADYDGLRQDFNGTLEQLSDTISQVIDASASIRGRSTEISRASEDLSNRTENQAATLEETAAALDELTASVKSAADGARQVEGIVRQAREEAEQSAVVVQGAVAAMSEIRKSSDQISQIIGVIDDIAFQTNLLALNAGVEAARAGDAGRGFAVVASEVRALAQRSSAAAKEIKTLISASTQHVGRGVEQVDRTGEALASIVDRVSHISTLISDIAAGAGEQSTGLAEINLGITQLDQVTQQNAAMVEESTAASHALHQEASGLSDLVGHFQTVTDGRSVPKAPARVIAVPQPANKPANKPADKPAVRPAGRPAQPVRSIASAAPREVKSATTGRGVWQEF